jgi:hypothetical protein
VFVSKHADGSRREGKTLALPEYKCVTSSKHNAYFVGAETNPHCGERAEYVAVCKQGDVTVCRAADINYPLAPQCDCCRVFAAGVPYTVNLRLQEGGGGREGGGGGGGAAPVLPHFPV